MQINFVTSNQHKVKEANIVGKNFGITFTQIDEEYPEIRNESVEEVARVGAISVFQRLNIPLIVEDTGLYISALNGFPGSYSAFTFKKIGNDGILNLLRNFKDRSAEFICAVGYCDANTLKVFKGKVEGEISKIPRGVSGFGYDPIFLPNIPSDIKDLKDRGNRTFAEDIKLKSEISHRTMAFKEFCQWLREEYV